MTKSKRGPIAGTEEARRGGQAVRDQYGPNYYRTIGKKGGAAASVRIGPDGYRALGQKGGTTTKARYGEDFYRRIGQIGGSKRRRPKQPGQAPSTAEDQASAEAGGDDWKAEPQ